MVRNWSSKKCDTVTSGHIFLIVGLNISSGQENTVGTLLNVEGNSGYILFAPLNPQDYLFN